jgi:hypothetical protein
VTTSPPQTFSRASPANQSSFASVFGWITVASTGLLLGSGAFDALRGGLPSRWGQAAVFAIFVLAHVGTIGRQRPPIARALASLLFLGCVLEAYWFSWGPQDGTVFAWSNLTLEAVRDGLLLWSLGLGALVLTLAPPSAHMRLLGAMLGLFLMTPWIWGLAHGSSRLTIIEGPQWLDWGWYVQPAFLGLSLLLPVALIALVETAYKISGMGALEHGVTVGLGFLSLAPVGLILLHQFAPDIAQPAPQVSAADLEHHGAAEDGGPATASHATSSGAGGQHDRHPSSLHATDRRAHQRAPHHGETRATETATDELPPAWGEGPNEDLSVCSELLHPEHTLDDLKAAFVPDEWRAISTLLLARRYPDAAWVVNAQTDPSELRNMFPQPPVSWRRVVLGMSSAIYESVRQVGFEQLNETSYSYPLGAGQMLELPRLNLFPRSALWSTLPKPIRDLQLTTTTFQGEGGAKQLEDLLDRLNAYTWSLLTEVALLDQTAGRDIAARDAVLANLAYNDAYLTYARNIRPDDYRKIIDDPAIRTGILLLWDRAVCALRLSGTEARLGIDDVALIPLVFSVDTPPEVDRLRAASDHL